VTFLTTHENESFRNQTVYVSGQAFIRCTFVGCTLVLRESMYHMDECSFSHCNWHIDCVLVWGSPQSLQQVKAVVSLLEQVQEQLQSQAGQQGQGGETGPGGAGGQEGGPPPPPPQAPPAPRSPFA
jgi:hypothetical protein